MSKEKRRVPKLRFPGFTEDWEQRKLGEFTNQINTFVNPEDAKLPLWSLTAEAGLIEKTDRYERDFLVKKKDQFKRIENNTLVYNPMNITIGSIDIYTGLYPIAVSGYYVSIVYDKNIDTDFLKEVLLLPSSLKMYKNYATGSLIERQRVQYPTFSKLQLLFPNPDEQRAIGQLFKSLNLNITLHQRKLEHLNLKKKALLQKLFPKDGERYPELRFPGFTDAWEQCKLNEFLSVSNLKNTEDKYNKKDVLSVSGDYGIVNQIEFQGRSFAGVSVSNYGVVETGDIVYTKSPLKLNPYGIIKTNRINNGIVSTLYAIYKTKENCDSKFIEHYFNLDSRLNKYLKPLVNKGAKNDMKVSSENALIGEVCFPHITEQKLIADFLDWLDVYITLHQRKLEDLQLQKKALLQQMFV